MAHEGERSDRRSRQDGQEIRWKKKVPIKHFPPSGICERQGGGGNLHSLPLVKQIKKKKISPNFCNQLQNLRHILVKMCKKIKYFHIKVGKTREDLIFVRQIIYFSIFLSTFFNLSISRVRAKLFSNCRKERCPRVSVTTIRNGCFFQDRKITIKPIK